MEYCPSCGQPLEDGAAFCAECGRPVDPASPGGSGYGAAGAPNTAYNGYYAPAQVPYKKTTIQIIAEVFMILGIISSCWLLIPLAWTIPMTVAVFRRHKRHDHIGTGLKVCTLLFVNLIAGIILLCDND